MEFRHNQLSILTSVPYLNNHNNQQTRTHTLQHREVRLVKYTYVCVYIFIFIYIFDSLSLFKWMVPHKKHGLQHNKTLSNGKLKDTCIG